MEGLAASHGYRTFVSSVREGDLGEEIELAVRNINAAHLKPSDLSSEELKTFEASLPLFRAWNERHQEMPILTQLEESSPHFPKEHFRCYFETAARLPLIVIPALEEMDLIAWASSHQETMKAARAHYGAVVFRDFGTTQESFPDAFEAVTGAPTKEYGGDTPRGVVDERRHVYRSSAENPEHDVGLHQEESPGPRDRMPSNLGFMCKTPADKGGATLLAWASEVTESIKKEAPEIWHTLTTKKTTTNIARYLPEGLAASYIRWLNHSHGTIKMRFGTEDRAEVEEKCLNEGLDYRWDGGWLVVSRSGIPTTVEVGQSELYCNQIHLEQINPGVCGGWANYMLARCLLYPTQSCMQFTIQFDDGTEITPQMAARLHEIIKQHEHRHQWKAGDLLVLNNLQVMHGKEKHEGKREVFVVMN